MVREVDLAALLQRILDCRTLIATGQKAAGTLAAITGCETPDRRRVRRCRFRRPVVAALANLAIIFPFSSLKAKLTSLALLYFAALLIDSLKTR